MEGGTGRLKLQKINYKALFEMDYCWSSLRNGGCQLKSDNPQSYWGLCIVVTSQKYYYS